MQRMVEFEQEQKQAQAGEKMFWHLIRRGFALVQSEFVSIQLAKNFPA